MSSNEEPASQKLEGKEPPEPSLVTRAGAQKGHSLQRVERTGRDIPGNQPAAPTDAIFPPVSHRVLFFQRAYHAEELAKGLILL